MNRELGRGHYRAEQMHGAVIVFAEGAHSVPGSTVFLEESPDTAHPRAFMLCHEIPVSVLQSVDTPFEAVAMFCAAEPIERIHVYDADGEHTVCVSAGPCIVRRKKRKPSAQMLVRRPDVKHVGNGCSSLTRQ